MKKGERKQTSMQAVAGRDGWQSLARTVIYMAKQESEGHLIITSYEWQLSKKAKEKKIQEARDFFTCKSEYRDLLFALATFEKDTGDNITDGTDCTIQ